MIIYRVVDESGNGYKKSLDSDILNWSNEGSSKRIHSGEYSKFRPLPENDGIPISRIRKYHHFGFKNIKQFHKWFLPADQALGALLNGKLHLYSVSKSNIILGHNQLIFDKRKAKLIESLPMNNFLDDKFKNSLFDFKENYLEGIDMDMEIPEKLINFFNS